MGYEDKFSETPFDVILQKVSFLEEMGFTSEEASRFARLLFRSAEGNVILSLNEEEKLAEYKEKQEELISILKYDAVIHNIVEIMKNGFSSEDAKKFASFLYRSKSQNPIVTLTKSQEDELEVYKKKYHDLSPESYFDILGEKYVEQPLNATIEDTSGQRKQEEDKLLRNIKRKLMTGEPLDSLEKIFQQKHMKKNN